jgi:orotate phosphoribosyltransferase
MSLNDVLAHSLYKIGAIKFGEFTLKSGQSSKIYVDLRKIISYPELLQAVSNALWEKVRECQFDLICGVPYTALPIATCISLQYNIPMIMRRKEKKAYGTKQQIEGNFQAGQSCLIVEDIITSGSSILETADDLIEAGLKIMDVIVLIDREQGGNENLKQRQFKLHTVLVLKSIMKQLLSSNVLPRVEQKIVLELLQMTT